MRNKIEEILNQRTKSPTPHLQADPFLPTRIVALSKEAGKKDKTFRGLYEWTFASLVTSCAIIIGIYIGNSLIEEDTSADMISDISSLVYQTDYIENLNTVLESGGTEK